MLNIIIMLNNYFHDLATALLMTSGVVVYYFAKAAEDTNDQAVIKYFTDSYRRLTILGRGAFVWIIVAGVFRLINFQEFEWAQAVGKNMVPVLIMKHVLIFGLVGGGLYFWRKLNQKVIKLRQTYELESNSTNKEADLTKRVAPNQ